MRPPAVPFRLYLHLSVFLVLLSSFMLGGGEDPRLANILAQLHVFSTTRAQQKVYLHLDKEAYTAGEDIWYKAYLLNGATHLADTLSTNLIVQLVNTHNAVVQSQLLRIKNGCAHGDFMLKDTVTEGNYLIKAFTVWMSNFDDAFIFSKHLYIRNPGNSNSISLRDIKFNKKFNKKRKELQEETDVQFLPEGGNLVYGIPGRLAFKAVTLAGKPVAVSGSIKDEHGNLITSFQDIYGGMGAVPFTPARGKKYYAYLQTGTKDQRKISLPAPLERGFVMMVDNLSSEENILVHLHSNLPPTADEYASQVILIGQTRGLLCFSAMLPMGSDSLSVSIPKKNFPTGIAQITLFNGLGMPVAERLVFVNHHDALNLSITGIHDSTTAQGVTKLLVAAKDVSGKPVKGNFSAAVIKGHSADSSGTENNLRDYLWLTSDLAVPVNDPGYYFNNPAPRREMALDLLMMTNGWRRFDWNKLVAGEFPKILYKEETGIEISGQITRNFFQIPMKNARVYLTVLNAYNDYYSTIADKMGHFTFGNLDYRDTVSVVLEATRPNGKHNIVINIDETQSPELNIRKGETFNQQLLAKGADWDYRKVKRPDYGWKDKERQKERERYAPYRLYSEADNVIYMDDVPTSYSNLLDVIQGRVPGVLVQGNSVVIRGTNSLFGDLSPLFLVDGLPVDLNTFSAINPKDVEMIEFLKGPSAAIYGIRGGNGVIAAYTRHGEFMKRGFFDFKILGYYTPRVFYSPYASGSAGPSPTTGAVTICWKPELVLDENGEAVISFPNKGNEILQLELEGVSSDGKPGFFNGTIHP